MPWILLNYLGLLEQHNHSLHSGASKSKFYGSFTDFVTNSIIFTREKHGKWILRNRWHNDSAINLQNFYRREKRHDQSSSLKSDVNFKRATSDAVDFLIWPFLSCVSKTVLGKLIWSNPSEDLVNKTEQITFGLCFCRQSHKLEGSSQMQKTIESTLKCYRHFWLSEENKLLDCMILSGVLVLPCLSRSSPDPGCNNTREGAGRRKPGAVSWLAHENILSLLFIHNCCHSYFFKRNCYMQQLWEWREWRVGKGFVIWVKAKLTIYNCRVCTRLFKCIVLSQKSPQWRCLSEHVVTDFD